MPAACITGQTFETWGFGDIVESKCLVAPTGVISSMPGEHFPRRFVNPANAGALAKLSFLRKQESMLESEYASLDSRVRGNDMNSDANFCN